MMTTLLFYGLSTLLFTAALFVILSRNPIHSALWLVTAFFAVAGHYVLLNAQFLAAVHVIVYAGAIMVLFLFTIMLLNLNKETEPQHSLLVKLAGLVAGGMLLVVMVGALRRASADTADELVAVHGSVVGLVENLGKTLFRDFLLPFELSSLLFLAALVGAVVLGKKELGE